jgi:hypothetical protein
MQQTDSELVPKNVPELIKEENGPGTEDLDRWLQLRNLNEGRLYMVIQGESYTCRGSSTSLLYRGRPGEEGILKKEGPLMTRRASARRGGGRALSFENT